MKEKKADEIRTTEYEVTHHAYLSFLKVPPSTPIFSLRALF
jgi:hypothetical protein